MAVNKNFVVKNGLEVNTDLILADVTSNSVGIGTSVTNYKLHVNGGIGATDITVTGFGTISDLSGDTINYTTATFSVGTATTLSGSTLNYSGIATVGSLSIGADEVISSAKQLKNIASLDSTTTATIESAIANAPNTFTNLVVTGVSTLGVTGITTLNVSGIATFANVDINAGDIDVSTLDTTDLYVSGITTLGTVEISSGIVTATSGIVTYYGDGTNLSLAGNPDLLSSTGIGIGTTGGLVGYGITFVNFYGAGVSTSLYDSSVGIATIFFEGGGGGGGAIGIGSTFPGTLLSLDPEPSNGDLFFHIDYGRTFIYYDEVTLGVGSSAFWIDSSPFNQGLNAVLAGVAFSTGSASSPSAYFEGYSNTGWFSPAPNEFGVVSSGSTILTVNSSGVTVTGVTTSTSAVIGAATTFTEDLVVQGDARVTGILTVGTSSVTIDGTNNQINVGSGLTLSSSGIIAGVVTAISFSGDGSGLTGVGVGTGDNINTTGIITASGFFGSGDKLIFSPTPTSFSPTDGSTGVTVIGSSDISITYDQPILAGVGTITLREDSASGSIVESFEVGVSTRATISNQTLTIDPTNDYSKYSQEYYLVVPQGSVVNYVDGNNSLLDTYNFTTEAGPTVSSFSPADDSTGVSITTNIVITFDKTIRAGIGTITLRTGSATGTIVESYDVTSSARLTFSTNTLTIDPTSDLSANTLYYLVIPSGSIDGYAGTDTYNFTSSNTVNTFSPSNGSTNVNVNTDITLTFAGTPTRGTGTITLRRDSATGTILASYDAATASEISISGNNWILNPSQELAYERNIYLVIPSEAVIGYSGLNVSGGQTYSFSTPTVPALGSSFAGGYLIAKTSGTIGWIVSPRSSEISRSFYGAPGAVSTAAGVSGCSGWFLPTFSQLQNLGYACRSYWDCYSSWYYWSSTPAGVPNAGGVVRFSDGFTSANWPATSVYCARAFRCITY